MYKTPGIGRVVCDHHFAVARTTDTAIKARVAPPKDDVVFFGKIVTVGGTFTPGQARSFGSLDYITDHSGELCLFKKTTLYPPLGFLGDDLEVLAY
jgi:hypothetical protein